MFHREQSDFLPFLRPLLTLQAALCLCCVAIVSPAGTASAQPAGEEQGFEVSSIEFRGNAVLSTSDLKAQLATKESPGFLSKFFHYHISERLGSKIEYFNPAVFGEDVKRLMSYYAARGFSAAEIDTSLNFSLQDSSISILLTIREGYWAILDSLGYGGIAGLPEHLAGDIRSGEKIARGDHFNAPLLQEEIQRVLGVLHDNGYPNARYQRDSSWARRYASTGNYAVELSFSPGKWCMFGPVAVEQEVDTLQGGQVRPDITDDIIFTQLDYKPGDMYSQAALFHSERNLNRLGIFDLRGIRTKVPSDADSSNAVPSVITIRPKDKYELAPELITSNENDALNLGLGIVYTDRNFIGGARTFSTHLRFRTQTLGEFPNYFGLTTPAVSSIDLTFELLQPYIFSNKIRGNWSFSLIVDKQKAWRQNIVQNKIGFSDRFAEFTNGFLDWTLEVTNLRVNQDLLDTTIFTTRQQFRLLPQKEFNSILSFTIQRDKTNDVFSPSEGFVHSATFEEAGILPLFLKHALDLPFAQFYRVSLVGRWYYDLSGHRFSIFAMKLKGGVEQKYGETRSDTTRSIPTLHRFYAGGSGSIRGWNSHGLISTGVGSEFGGNLQFEGSFELRMNLFQSLKDDLLDKIWLVPSIDYGNVWPDVRNFQLTTVAIAAAIGLRYDTIFGPFRVDYGFRLYDPGGQTGRKWITERRFFGETLAGGVLHFGIGNAF